MGKGESAGESSIERERGREFAEMRERTSSPLLPLPFDPRSGKGKCVRESFGKKVSARNLIKETLALALLRVSLIKVLRSRSVSLAHNCALSHIHVLTRERVQECV